MIVIIVIDIMPISNSSIYTLSRGLKWIGNESEETGHGQILEYKSTKTAVQ